MDFGQRFSDRFLWPFGLLLGKIMGYKLGPWHGADMPPVREGVYETDETKIKGVRCFAYWNGERFMYRVWKYKRDTLNFSIQEAWRTRFSFTVLPERATWRGILK